MEKRTGQSGFGEPQFLNFEGDKGPVEPDKEVLHEPITREAIVGALLRTRGYNPYTSQLGKTQLFAKEGTSVPYVFSYDGGKGKLTYDELTHCNELLKTIDVEAEFEAARQGLKSPSSVQNFPNADVRDDDEDERRGYKKDSWGGPNYI